MRVSDWMDLYFHTHAILESGIIRLEWPDQGTYLDQDNVVVEVFDIIKDEILTIRKRKKTGNG